MRYDFTKQQVIKAIIEEPLKLKQGSFLKQNGECTVCAVGAVLRATHTGAIAAQVQINDPYNHMFSSLCEKVCEYRYTSVDDLDEALDEKNYLGALSIFFESEIRRGASDEERRMALINFVEAFFPDKFTVQV